jgi:hypothetical protein
VVAFNLFPVFLSSHQCVFGVAAGFSSPFFIAMVSSVSLSRNISSSILFRRVIFAQNWQPPVVEY